MTAAAAALATAVHKDPTSYGSVWGIEALNGKTYNATVCPKVSYVI